MLAGKLIVSLGCCLLLSPMMALAQAAPATNDPPSDPPSEAPSSNLSWSLAFTTDYVYRGITQSDYQPALQAGLNYSFGESGIYAGVWGSNVDFADTSGPDIELDTYVGYSKDLSDDWNVDVMLTRYTYLGAQGAYGSIDFNQLDAKLSYREMLTLTTSYSNDYANGGYSYRYYSLSGTKDIGHGIGLNASAGHTTYSDGNGSYNDFSIGASRQFGRVNVALNYIDTNIDDVRASDRLVLTLAIE